MRSVGREELAVVKNAEHEDQAKLTALRQAIIAGENSGVYEGDAVGEIRERVRRRTLAKRNDNA